MEKKPTMVNKKERPSIIPVRGKSRVQAQEVHSEGGGSFIKKALEAWGEMGMGKHYYTAEIGDQKRGCYGNLSDLPDERSWGKIKPICGGRERPP